MQIIMLHQVETDLPVPVDTNYYHWASDYNSACGLEHKLECVTHAYVWVYVRCVCVHVCEMTFIVCVHGCVKHACLCMCTYVWRVKRVQTTTYMESINYKLHLHSLISQEVYFNNYHNNYYCLCAGKWLTAKPMWHALVLSVLYCENFLQGGKLRGRPGSGQ